MFKEVSQTVAISTVAIFWLQFSKPRNQGPKVHMPNKYLKNKTKQIKTKSLTIGKV